MSCFIENLVEPQSLLLYWQASESKQRSRHHVGQLIKRDGEVILQYNNDIEADKAKKLGFQGYPAFPLKTAEHGNQVMEAFKRRLPPRNRRDFGRYLELRAIPADAEISDFALLGYSGGKLPDDSFELVHPFNNPPTRFELLIEIAGFRYEAQVKIEQLQLGDKVEFILEPYNEHDPKAIRMESGGLKLGYVPRGHLKMLHRMNLKGAVVEGEIFRTNGTSERPLVYTLTKLAHGN